MKGIFYFIMFVVGAMAVGCELSTKHDASPAPQAGERSDADIADETPAAAADMAPADVARGEAIYTLSTDAATMGNIVGDVHRLYRIPLCFEDVQYGEHDIVTLKDMVSHYEQIQKERPLSAHEQEIMSIMARLVAEGAKPELVVDVDCERYSKEFSGNTVAELLTAITVGTSYQWKEQNGTFLIYPRKNSSLDFTVSLDVTDVSLLAVVEAIVSQAPQGHTFSVNAVGTFYPPKLLEDATVPRLKMTNQPAIDALCRAVEAANRRIVWGVGGYTGCRNLSLGVVAENP